MSAIWRDSGQPSFLGVAPQFSFFDVAEVCAPCPESYAEAREHLRAWERKFGAVFYEHNAVTARELWLRKRPWWLC